MSDNKIRLNIPITLDSGIQVVPLCRIKNAKSYYCDIITKHGQWQNTMLETDLI